MNKLLKWFEYKHLPPSLRETSKAFHDLAWWIDNLPDSAEKTAGLRKLLEAKDCIVRAKKEADDDENAASNATS